MIYPGSISKFFLKNELKNFDLFFEKKSSKFKQIDRSLKFC